MEWTSEARARLGAALRASRERQGLTRAELAGRVAARGVSVTARTLGNLEKDAAPRRPTLAPVMAALGWLPGSLESVHGGGGPVVAGEADGGSGPVRSAPAVTDVFELYPAVVAFGRQCVRQGGDPGLRDTFEEAAEMLLGSVPGPAATVFGLAAYRPHAVGEPIPSDDHERIMRTMEGGDDLGDL